MPVPAKDDGARPDARLVPLLDYVAKLLALECQRRARPGVSAPAASADPPFQDGSS